jgi:hypothetical protein
MFGIAHSRKAARSAAPADDAIAALSSSHA